MEERRARPRAVRRGRGASRRPSGTRPDRRGDGRSPVKPGCEMFTGFGDTFGPASRCVLMSLLLPTLRTSQRCRRSSVSPAWITSRCRYRHDSPLASVRFTGEVVALERRVRSVRRGRTPGSGGSGWSDGRNTRCLRRRRRARRSPSVRPSSRTTRAGCRRCASRPSLPPDARMCPPRIAVSGSAMRMPGSTDSFVVPNARSASPCTCCRDRPCSAWRRGSSTATARVSSISACVGVVDPLQRLDESVARIVVDDLR